MQRPPTQKDIDRIVEHIMTCGKHLNHHELSESAYVVSRFRLDRVDVAARDVRQAPNTDAMAALDVPFARAWQMFEGMKQLLTERVKANYFYDFGDDPDPKLVYSGRVVDGLLTHATEDLQKIRGSED